MKGTVSKFLIRLHPLCGISVTGNGPAGSSKIHRVNSLSWAPWRLDPILSAFTNVSCHKLYLPFKIFFLLAFWILIPPLFAVRLTEKATMLTIWHGMPEKPSNGSVLLLCNQFVMLLVASVNIFANATSFQHSSISIMLDWLVVAASFFQSDSLRSDVLYQKSRMQIKLPRRKSIYIGFEVCLHQSN